MKHRCTHCNKLLAVGTGRFEIKCPRCKAVNRFSSLTTQNAAEHPNPQKGKNGCPKTTPSR
ncbi:TPA: Com family DNA-binding transcriptional regulator [Neisseria bacilliformis]